MILLVPNIFLEESLCLHKGLRYLDHQLTLHSFEFLFCVGRKDDRVYYIVISIDKISSPDSSAILRPWLFAEIESCEVLTIN